MSQDFMAKVYHFSPHSCFENPDEKNIALIKLNTPFNGSRKHFDTLWKKAALTAVVDGAVNELYKLSDRDTYSPDLITGDFDSADPDALDYYRKKGITIIPTLDQDETDFVKCLRIVTEKIGKDQLKVNSICVHVAVEDGRLDHIMANVNALFIAREMTDLPVFLISEESLAFLLPIGHSTVHTGSSWQGTSCGLIPFDGPCKSVTTTGFEYNMDHQRSRFGELVSTSNCLMNDVVTIETDNSLLFMVTMKKHR